MSSVLGAGLFLPPTRPVRDLVLEAGGDPSVHDGWEHACVAADHVHPSEMAAHALDSALRDAGVPSSVLRLVISAGVSRDYVPSWSLASEVMLKHGVPSSCLGLDMTIGCMGMLAALPMATGWLMAQGGGYAAIVCAEKWSHTIDRRSAADQGLWGHADGAGALIVGVNVPDKALAIYQGAQFSSYSDFNGLVLIKYGGTRHPTAPPGQRQFGRTLRGTPAKEIWTVYRAQYASVITDLVARYKFKPHRLICNQISPRIVSTVAELAGVPEDRTCRSGQEYGHVGAADMVIGLRRLADAGQLDGPVLLAGSTPYAFGAGLLVPP